MLKQTPKNRVLFVRICAPVLLVFFGVFSLAFTALRVPQHALAATTSTVNFQARLQTAAGAIVPDNTYNVEFKLYSGASCDPTTGSNCTVQWTEDYLNSQGHGLQTINGYLSTGLGSRNAFPATINWDQQLWLSMNIGGTTSGTVTWDGAMLPYLSLTGVPYAFSAGQLQTTSGSNTSTLNIAASSHGSQTFVLQDQGAAGTYSLLTSSAADNSYIKLQTSLPLTPQTGNLDITGAAVAGSLQAASLDTASSGGTLTIGGTNATGGITLSQNTTIGSGKSITITGSGTRPSSPTAGMLYYDTLTNTLLTYNGAKWMSDKTAATKIVAMGTATGCTGSSPVASNNPDGADYVSTSCTAADTTIQSAINALPSGGTVYLEEGTYIVSGTITLPNNITLVGAGNATVLKIKDSYNAGLKVISNSSATGAGINVANLEIDGNNSAQTTGAMYGVYMSNVGSSSRDTARVTNITVVNMGVGGSGTAVDFASVVGGVISGNTFRGGYQAISIESGSSNTTVANNTINSTTYAIAINGSNNSITANTITGGTFGITMSASYNVITNNNVNGSPEGMYVGSGSSNTISSNVFRGNTSHGIYLNFLSQSVVSGNKIYDSGNTTANNGIYLNSGDSSDTITSNNITDSSCTTTCYAINIVDSLSSGNTLSGNYYSPGSINDAGTNTIYANQADSSGNLINRGTGAVGINTSTVSASLSLQGGLVQTQLPAPAAPSLSKTGGATATYGYKVTALDGMGETAASSETTIAGNSTLSSTNNNTITWKAVPGAYQYKIYRTTVTGGSPTSIGLIGTVTGGSTPSFTDTGIAANTTVTAPSSNTTGGASFAGGLQAASLDTTSAGGTVSIGSSTVNNAATITIGGGTAAQSISIGTGSAETLTLGGSLTSSTSTTTIQGGTGAGAVLIQAGSGGTLSIGSNSVANSIQIGAAGTNSGNTQNINIGNVGSGGTTNVLIGSSSAASGGTTTLQGATSVAVGNGTTPLITVGTTNGGTISVGSIGSSTNATTIHIADTTAAAQTVTVGSTSGASATTIQGGTQNVTLLTNSSSASIVAKTGTNSLTGFQIQNASSVALLTADTVNSRIIIGDTTNGITLSATGGIVANGTAQHTKQIALTAEYPGAVLDAASDGTCSGATNGTMTSGFDSSSYMNYYKWAANASAQCYDVVVRVPLPSDFNGWATSTPLTIKTYTSNTSSGLINVDVHDSNNGSEVGCTYVAATPGSAGSWASTGSGCTLTGTYAANGMFTLRIRMTGTNGVGNGNDVRIGGITLNYNSKF